CFRKKLNEDFKTAIAHVEIVRNTRIAHLENTAVSPVRYDLNILLSFLAELYSGLGKIIIFLENPHYIVREKWTIIQLSTKDEALLELNNSLDQCLIVRDCLDILELAEKNSLNDLTSECEI